MLTCGPCVNLFPVQRKKTFVYSTVLLIPTLTINDTVHLYSVLYSGHCTVQCVHQLASQHGDIERLPVFSSPWSWEDWPSCLISNLFVILKKLSCLKLSFLHSEFQICSSKCMKMRVSMHLYIIAIRGLWCTTAAD